jgi:hypothetical protein
MKGERQSGQPDLVEWQRMGKESQPTRELEVALVTAYAATFIPRWDRYPVQLSSGSYIQLPQPLTLETIAAHLEDYRCPDRQSVTIGAYALNETGYAKWVCFDADQESRWAQLLSMAQKLQNSGIRGYLEQSRRGGHLWLFTPRISGSIARRFGHQLAQEHNIEQIEIYPKQASLEGLEGAGSFVRLPLGLHRKDMKVHHFINPDGSPLAPAIHEQLILLAAPQLVPHEFINAVLARSPEEKVVVPSPTFEKVKSAPGEKLSDRLVARVTVYDFVSQFVPLDSRGVGHCPFHDDQHRSFQVNIQKNYWNCYATGSGCGGGSLIHFWQKWREAHGQSPDFKETVTELAQMLL